MSLQGKEKKNTESVCTCGQINFKQVYSLHTSLYLNQCAANLLKQMARFPNCYKNPQIQSLNSSNNRKAEEPEPNVAPPPCSSSSSFCYCHFFKMVRDTEPFTSSLKGVSAGDDVGKAERIMCLYPGRV